MPRQVTTINDLAAVMRVSRYTVRRLIDAGEIEAERFGGQIRIHADSVEQYRARQKMAARRLAAKVAKNKAQKTAFNKALAELKAEGLW
ncbi:MAG TPA: helix-turn-helix domain-containing protein [Rhizomicrobium sp.]|nr:helix-turn-helix domain-containing protein [Rhizomicrobium sp.]